MTDATRPVLNRAMDWKWLIPLGLALLASIGFFAFFALPYLLFDAEVLARFEGRRVWIIVHVAAGSVALFTGPFQLWMGATGTAMALHRKLGMLYLLSIAISSLTAFYLAVTTQVTWMFGMGLGGLGCAWVVTTGMAFLAVRRHMYVQHKEWMIRSYVVTLGFVFFRMFVGVTSALEVGTLFERLTAASWFCWAFPLLITEAIIQGRKMFPGKTKT